MSLSKIIILAYCVFEIDTPQCIFRTSVATFNMVIASESTALILLPTQPSSSTYYPRSDCCSSGISGELLPLSLASNAFRLLNLLQSLRVIHNRHSQEEEQRVSDKDNEFKGLDFDSSLFQGWTFCLKVTHKWSQMSNMWLHLVLHLSGIAQTGVW